MARLRAWRKPLTLVGLALGIVLFAREFILSLAAAKTLGSDLAKAPAVAAAALISALLVYVAQMIAWQFTLRCLGVGLGMAQIVEGFQLSFLPRYIPGSIWGYLGRSQWLQQAHGIGYGVSMIGSLIETVLQAATALIVGLIGLSVRGPAHLSWLVRGCAVAAFVLLSLAGAPVMAWFARRLTKGNGPAVHPGMWSAAVVSNLALRLVYGLSFVAVARVVSGSADADPFAAIGAANLSWLLGFIIPIVPTGIGVREWALGQLLTQPGLLSAAHASLAAVLFRLVIILAELLWLVVGLMLFAHRWRRQRRS